MQACGSFQGRTIFFVHRRPGFSLAIPPSTILTGQWDGRRGQDGYACIL